MSRGHARNNTTTTPFHRRAWADHPKVDDLPMMVRSTVADLQTVACPTGVCYHPDDRLPAADRNWVVCAVGMAEAGAGGGGGGGGRHDGEPQLFHAD